MGRIEIDPKTKEPVYVAKWFGKEEEENKFWLSWGDFAYFVGVMILFTLAMYGLLHLIGVVN